MAITIFEDRNFGGRDQEIVGDVENFGRTEVGRNPTSILMGAGDAVLLCKKPSWNGEVMYLRGPRRIEDLGVPSEGGKSGFSNSIMSARTRPFKIEMNITVVTGTDGTMPGLWTDRDQVESDLDSMVDLINQFFRRENALLRIEICDTTFRPDERKFNMSKAEQGSIPMAWKKPHKVDVVFVNQISGAVGIGSFPWMGRFCLVAAKRDNIQGMARTWAHELGHYWGLTHREPMTEEMINVLTRMNPALSSLIRPDNNNIMIQSSNAGPLSLATIDSSQLNDVHQKLARNIQRKGDRIEEIAESLV